MEHLILPILGLIFHTAHTWGQGDIESTNVQADTFLGERSRSTGNTNQDLGVSQTADALHIAEGNFVIMPGLSASNSCNDFANEGIDFDNVCETSFNSQEGQLQQGTTLEWPVVSRTGGSLINRTLPQELFHT